MSMTGWQYVPRYVPGKGKRAFRSHFYIHTYQNSQDKFPNTVQKTPTLGPATDNTILDLQAGPLPSPAVDVIDKIRLACQATGTLALSLSCTC